MPSRLRQPVSRLHTRRCVRCGYDGALLKDGRAPRCARCGCDLRARPAMTYAEMEGFLDAAPQRPDSPRPAQAAPPTGGSANRLHGWERWLVVAIVATAVLAACALVVVRSLRGE